MAILHAVEVTYATPIWTTSGLEMSSGWTEQVELQSCTNDLYYCNLVFDHPFSDIHRCGEISRNHVYT